MQLIDLTHVLADGMITYPGLPGPLITDHLSWEQSRSAYAPGTEFQIGRISMVANTGTYLDAPAHRYRGAADLAALALQRVAGLPGVLVTADSAAGPAVDLTRAGGHDLAGRDVAGHAVLIRTGWDRHWGTDRYGEGDAPFLTAGSATMLAEQGAVLVGIDSVNIDSTSDGHRPVHSTLLGAVIPILEHLTNLAALPPGGFEVHAAPVPVHGMGTFPVRAYALVRD